MQDAQASSGEITHEGFCCRRNGRCRRPLIAELLARAHAVVALTRSPQDAEALAKRGIEPAIADVFDADAVKAVMSRAQPEVVIAQLTALPEPTPVSQ